MKNIGKELDRIITEKGMVKKKLAEHLGITPAWLIRLLKQPSIDCEMLDRICKFVGIHPGYFFDDGNYGTSVHATSSSFIGDATTHVEVTRGEVDMLKRMLAEKERTIQILMASKGFEIGTKTGQTD